MGNSQSINIPTENKYFISYCKQYDVTIEDIIFKDSIELILNYENISSNFILSIIYSQINNLGYSIKLKVPTYNIFKKDSSIKEIIEYIEKKGFLCSDYSDILSDLIFDYQCYYPRLPNIKYLLNKNNILIAGIILDNNLMKSLNLNFPKKDVTDIICIVGYDNDHILIKSTWIQEKILLKNEFINNIKEIWTINIKSPDNK
jgi:hypothetical protein